MRLRHLLPLLLGLWAVVAVAAQAVRPSAIAGSWYPADPMQLGAILDQLLAEATPPKAAPDPATVRALLLPHAAYAYSGKVAVQGVALLRRRHLKRVIVLAPAHWAPDLHGLSIAGVSAYQTPLGEVSLDQDAVASLRRSPLVSSHPQAHRREHSIEIQLPLLQRAWHPGWTLVPILVGQMSEQDYRDAAELLRPLLDPDTVVLVSSDFTHYGTRFNYQPFAPTGSVAERLRALDMGAYEYITKRDPQGFDRYHDQTGITICGFGPIMVLLHLLPPNTTATLLDYATSGALTGSYENSVSYLAAAFGAPRPKVEQSGTSEPAPLSHKDMQRLLELARSSIDLTVRQEPSAEQRLDAMVAAMPPVTRAEGAAFVTLWEHGELRGCIGNVPARDALAESVRRNAIGAALADRRFRPVTPQELGAIELELTVLSPLHPIASYLEFQPGRDGVLLEKDGRHAVYLPQVARQYGWNREQTLSALAEKAGLPADAWREGARLSVFTAQSYGPTKTQPAGKVVGPVARGSGASSPRSPGRATTP